MHYSFEIRCHAVYLTFISFTNNFIGCAKLLHGSCCDHVSFGVTELNDYRLIMIMNMMIINVHHSVLRYSNVSNLRPSV